MKRYRVESRSGKNHFRADCTEEELDNPNMTKEELELI
ncbi:Uncharacterised protein [uncultured Clostridium sp.]|nr:Uncharacterised protein [uncultured Clostridium sp.]